MSVKMSDEWKEFFINCFISCSDEGIEEPDRKHLYYDNSKWRRIKNFFLKFYYKRDKNKIHALNGKLYGKDAERYTALNDFLNCEGLYYKIFMKRYNEIHQTDYEACGSSNPFVRLYIDHFGIDASLIIFDYFIRGHDKLPEELPQEYVLNLSMDLLRLFSIFMTENERKLNFLYLETLYPGLFKDSIEDYLKVLAKYKDDNTTRV